MVESCRKTVDRTRNNPHVANSERNTREYDLLDAVKADSRLAGETVARPNQVGDLAIRTGRIEATMFVCERERESLFRNCTMRIIIYWYKSNGTCIILIQFLADRVAKTVPSYSVNKYTYNVIKYI